MQRDLMSEAAFACRQKMQESGINAACQQAFLENLKAVENGATGCIPESFINPIQNLPSLESLSFPDTLEEEQQLIRETVVLKLNGGLGTAMGLKMPKSLLRVKEEKTVMDLIVMHIKELWHFNKMKIESSSSSSVFPAETCVSPSPSRPYFMLMNSLFTTDLTHRYLLENFHDFGVNMKSEIELMQNWVPKIRQKDLFPVEWPQNPMHEWSPPGHGDIYASLYGSGKLDHLLKEGFRYMFVSNCDNLGSTLDIRILNWMHQKHIPFVVEVCTRTMMDQKGGHLAQLKSDPDKLVLREAAQCPPEDISAFKDINRHRFFNTNNIWLDLFSLKKSIDSQNGTLLLPTIRNSKTVDPSNPLSVPVYHLETAMGSAIGNFDGAAAVVVPRDRFTPIKLTRDLLLIRSDACILTSDLRIILNPLLQGVPPEIVLDQNYTTLDELEKLIEKGVPSLVHCNRLCIKGKVLFGGPGIVIKGNVTIENTDASIRPLVVAAGTVLENTTFSNKV